MFKKILRVVIAGSIYIFFNCKSFSQNKDVKTKYVALVNRTIGMEGDHWMTTGFIFPGATYPFGMVQLTPTFFKPQKGFVINQISG